MSDSAVDETVFAFLVSCVGDFVKWPQCTHVSLRGHNYSGRVSTVLFRVVATNFNDRTVFRIVVTNDGDWRVRVTQVSNHIILDECDADRGTIVNAVNRFAELAGMRGWQES